MSAEIFHVGVESSASPVVKLEDMLPHRLMTLAGGVTRALSKALARHDVAASEWQMIAALGSFGEITAKDVIAHTDMHKTNVSRATASLLRRNFITRRSAPPDMRRAYLQLTPSGRDLYEQCARYVAGLSQTMEDAIAPDDREAFHRGLMNLAERVDRLPNGSCKTQQR